MGECLSSQFETELGVPQGGGLSPKLFNLFIDDLAMHIDKDVKLVMFADDTTIAISSGSPDQLQLKAEGVLRQFCEWCSSNNLIVNPTKTTFINFRKRRQSVELNLNLNDVTIRGTSMTKFLGLCLDETLSWDDHLNLVAKKLNSAYFAIRNLRSIVDRNFLLNVYYNLAFPHINYLICYWGFATGIQRIFVLQKRIIRLIFCLGPLDSCKPIFQSANILTLSSVLIYECSLFVKQNRDKFKINQDVHNYSTRASRDIYLPNFNLTAYTKGPSYACGNIFNRLPHSIKRIDKLSTFKRELKEFLIKKCFYSIKDFLERD